MYPSTVEFQQSLLVVQPPTSENGEEVFASYLALVDVLSPVPL